MPNRSFLIIILFFTIVTSATSQVLPEFELPEYIILGVERATIIPAERLPNSQSITVTPGEIEIISFRPDFAAQSVEVVPVRMQHQVWLGESYVNASIKGGMFSYGQSFAEGAYLKPKHEVLGSVNLTKYPQRKEINWRGNGSGYAESAVSLTNIITGSLKIGYTSDWFNAEQNSLRYNINQYGLFSSFSLTPVQTGIGNFSPWFEYKNLTVEEIDEFKINLGKFSLSHHAETFTGSLQSEIRFISESYGDKGRDLTFTSLSTSYLKNINRVMFRLGIGAWNGGSFPTNRIQGLSHRIGFGFNTTLNGRLRLEWSSGAEAVTRYTLQSNFPALDFASGSSSIQEIISNIVVRFEQDFTDKFDAYLGFNSKDLRHSPTLYFNGSANVIDYNVETIRTEMSEFYIGSNYTMSTYAGVGTMLKIGNSITRNKAIGDEVPNAPLREFHITSNLNLLNTDFATSLIWMDPVPSDFEGSFEAKHGVVLNLSAQRMLLSKLLLETGVNNILNARHQSFYGYDSAPLTFWLGVKYGGRLTPKVGYFRYNLE